MNVAVIGASCRFPGANHFTEVPDLLKNGISFVREAPPERWDKNACVRFLEDEDHRLACRWGGFLDQIDQFDPLFFNISPREALLLDPQQRLMLELAWEGFEDAGYPPSAISGSNTGVFVGVCNYDYKELLDRTPGMWEGYSLTGTANTFLANRISRLFKVHGPSVSIDTACSSSLVAIHQAAESLESDGCELALAGGINVLCNPERYVPFAKLGMLSPDGYCRPFDARANGYVRGEGAGLLLLKRLDRALADGDRIHAVIRGSAVNHAGDAKSLTIPNPFAQSSVIYEAWKRSELSPGTATYIEAHGTGTPVGDPIEINGLRRAFQHLYRDFGLPAGSPHCAIGSIKPLVGHLEAAAGVAGLIKVLVAMRSHELPGIVNWEEQNPRIRLNGTPFFLANEPMRWDPDGAPRRAGVSSFGLGGTNAHVVIEELEQDSRPAHDTGLQWIPLSARSEATLRAQAAQLAGALERAPGTYAFDDVAFTMQCGREHLEKRCLLAAGNEVELKIGLTAIAAGERVWMPNPDSVPERLAEWLKGGAIDWPRGAAGERSRPVSLPSLQFERQRFWAPLENARHKPSISAEPDAGYIRDHMVGGERIVPGAAYFGWVKAASGITSRAVSFRDVCWAAPLIVRDAAIDCEIEVGGGSGLRRFEVRAGGVIHVSGTVAEERLAPPPDREDSKYNRMLRPAGPLYERLGRIGLSYGPAMRVLQNYSADAESAAGEFRTGGESALDPALIDGGLHLAAAVLLESGEGFPSVPLSIGEFTVWGDLRRAERAVARRIRGQHSFDIDWTAKDGEVCAIARHLAVRPLRPATPSFLYRPTWQAVEFCSSTSGEPTEVIRVDAAAQDAEAAVLDVHRRMRQIQGDRLLIIAPQAFAVEPGDTVSPVSAAAVAMALCLAKERPSLRVCCADAEGAEWDGKPGAPALIAVRDGRFWKPSLRELRLPSGNSPGPEGRVCLIVGGGRGIGLETGLWLARNSGARIVATGRRPMDDELRANLGRIRATGGTVQYFQADVTNLESMREMVRRAHEEFGPIQVAIHSALELCDRRIDQMSDADFLKAFRPKVIGAEVLAEVLRDEPLETILFYSSAVAVAGNAGQANYAAGCAAQEAVAARLRREVNYPVQVINWGYWGETGAVTGKAHAEALGRLGIKPIETGEGIRAIGAVLHSGVPHVVALKASAEVLESCGLVNGVRDELVSESSGVFEPQALEEVAALVGEQYDASAFVRETAAFAAMRPMARQKVRTALRNVEHQGGASAKYARLIGELKEFCAAPDDPVPGDSPVLQVHARLLDMCLDGLESVLLGQKAATGIVFSPDGAELAAAVYRGCEMTAWYNRVAAECVARIVDRQREQLPGRVGILEAGAGTGAATAAVLEALSARADRVEYIFTDVSRQFAATASRFPGTRFEVLDLERSPASQGFERASVDLLIAANVVHATKDVGQTLAHLKWLLKRNGTLVLSELCRPDFFTLLTFGLLDGWWRFEDGESRLPKSPLLSEQLWDRALAGAGFHLLRLFGAPDGAGEFLRQCVLVAASDGIVEEADAVVKAAAPAIPAAQEPTAPAPASTAELEDRIAAHLGRATGIPAEELDRDKPFSDYGVDSLVAMEMVRALSDELGQPVRPHAIFDYPSIRPLAQHLAANREPPQEKQKKTAARADLVSPAAAVTHRAPWTLNSAWGVQIRESSAISDVAVESLEVRDPAPDEIQVHPRAFGINFGDLLCVTGSYPSMPEYPFTPGFELAGVVAKTGSNVTGFRVGDEVIAVTAFRLGAHASAVNVPATFAARKPAGLDFHLAAGLPVVYLTAESALDRAAAGPKQRLVVQSAAGGVGQMAVRLALERGVEVYATAGSDERCALLERLGVTHAINYRRQDFAEEIRKITGGDGVDAVINMLASDAIQPGLDVLAPGGRYVELALSALLASEPVRVRGMADNQSFHVLDMRRAFLRRPENVRPALERMLARPDWPNFAASPAVFPFEDTGRAYVELQQRRVAGKIVVDVPERAWPAMRMPAVRSVAAPSAVQKIAIVGISGRFPGAPEVNTFWARLAAGADLVQGMPESRRRLIHGQPWPGAFLDDVDCFDPLFFNMSGTEAEFMDPQQRILLQECWKAIESAGIPAGSLSGTRTGIFLGGGTGDYLDALADAGVKLQPGAFTGNEASVCAARTAYFLNLKGPVMAISTACSSSLVAVHEACQALRHRECDAALAAGIFITNTRRFYDHCQRAGMLSPDGKCKTFGDGADGFAPGEAAGVLLLKPLERALADGDPIRGVILGTGVNQDGRTNGITAPSVASQTELVTEVLRKAGIDARSISYVECHGTGTRLGDPIEIEALAQAFRASTSDVQYCQVGSVKTNIGHTVTAAGVSGIIKVLLSMEHEKLPPSLHAETPNGRIPFSETPFRINDSLTEWSRESGPRRAAVSSFGFSGTNAHIILEEGIHSQRSAVKERSEFLFCVSAATGQALRKRIEELHAWLMGPGRDARPGDVSATLLRGRTHFRYRLATSARGLDELAEQLRRELAGQADAVWHGEAGRTSSVPPGNADISEWAAYWVNGGVIPDEIGWLAQSDRRIPMPCYPFERERYWAAPVKDPGLVIGASSRWLRDHRVAGVSVLPGAVFLELAREHAGARGLRDVRWKQSFPGGTLRLHMEDGGVKAENESGQIVFEAKVEPQPGGELGTLDLAQWRAECFRHSSGAECQAELRARGLEHGPTFQCVRDVAHNTSRAVVSLELTGEAREAGAGSVLHPSLLDGAWQVAGMLIGERGLWVPALVREIVWTGPIPESCVACVEATGATGVFDVTIAERDGRIVVRCTGLQLTPANASQTLVFEPLWEAAENTPRTPRTAPRRIAVAGGSEELLDALRSEFQESTVETAGTVLDTAVELLISAVPQAPFDTREAAWPQCKEYFDQARALAARGGERLRMMWLAPEDEGPSFGIGGALAALAGTIRLENPTVTAQVVVVSGAAAASRLAAVVAAEWNSAAPYPDQVRYAGSARKVRRLHPVLEGGRPELLRRSGRYLISGGAGTLGRALAEYLAGEWGAHVILLGRSQLTGAQAQWLTELGSRGWQVEFHRTDVSQAAPTFDVNGVFHLAGVLNDALLRNKTDAQIEAVLRSKIDGALALDRAFGNAPLDLFVVYASLAGLAGNTGQADYAFASALLDEFAAWRERRRPAGERQGVTLSIDWPLWDESAMGSGIAAREALSRAGLRPMPQQIGLAALDRSLQSGGGQRVVMYGGAAAISAFACGFGGIPESGVQAPGSAPEVPLEAAAQFVRKMVAEALRVPLERLTEHETFERFGVDSISAVSVVDKLEPAFGPLPKTLLFERTNLGELTAYFRERHGGRLAELLGGLTDAATEERGPEPVAVGAPTENAVAIIGLSGRFPDAPDLETFWANLEAGRDSIREIPPERWDHSRHYHPDRGEAGKTYGRWGGFLEQVGDFDPLFFHISPREASRMDPQERIFLECAWASMEDAGYTPQGLREHFGGNAAVFAGVMWSDYQAWAPESLRESGVLPSSSFASIANRVSWTLDLTGPSVALDTMCSSSLTALHLACQSLLQGECAVAFAGGVNLSLHPQKYLYLAQERFLSTDGRCRSFGEGGDGYVPGEGAGVVMLRPLAQAIAAGDRILGVIRATGISHGGHTHGYTVPSPRGQTDLIRSVLRRSGVAPETIGYVEAHGTGTALGDPIEIRSLDEAFRDSVPKEWRCPIGSVKANIGHLESAAGMASIAKVLLQFREGKIAPSIHTERLNPHIAFEDTLFQVSRTGKDWSTSPAAPRRAAISSFGAGGSNAHVILEQAPESASRPEGDGTPQLFVFSALSEDRLAALVKEWLAFLDGRGQREQMSDLAWTLQTGRVHWQERLALTAASYEELRRKLNDFVRGVRSEEVFRGRIDENTAMAANTPDAVSLAESLAGRRELEKLARLWVLVPLAVDWRSLYPDALPRRVGIPVYPFARERCWVTGNSEICSLLAKLRRGQCGVEEAVAAMERKNGYQ